MAQDFVLMRALLLGRGSGNHPVMEKWYCFLRENLPLNS